MPYGFLLMISCLLMELEQSNFQLTFYKIMSIYPPYSTIKALRLKIRIASPCVNNRPSMALKLAFSTFGYVRVVQVNNRYI
jgi:hypothetical protein